MSCWRPWVSGINQDPLRVGKPCGVNSPGSRRAGPISPGRGTAVRPQRPCCVGGAPRLGPGAGLGEGFCSPGQPSSLLPKPDPLVSLWLPGAAGALRRGSYSGLFLLWKWGQEEEGGGRDSRWAPGREEHRPGGGRVDSGRARPPGTERRAKPPPVPSFPAARGGSFASPPARERCGGAAAHTSPRL